MIPARILEAIDALPTIPKAAIELNKVLAQEDSTPRDVAKVVRPDPALTANLLRVVNSAASGLRREVTTVDQAASMLGQRRLQRIASMALLGRTLPDYLQGYGLSTEQLWSHCAAVAVLCERIALEVDSVQADMAFTAGLLHDIGKLAVGVALEEVKLDVLAGMHLEDHDLIGEERARLGTDHTEVGAALAGRWGLSPSLAAAAAHHHAPAQAPEADRPLVWVVHVANGLAHSLGFGADLAELHREVQPDAFEALGLEPEDVMMLISEGLEPVLDLAENLPPRP